jgi:hypothetical protein
VKALPKIAALVAAYAHKGVDYKVVYVTEAHPTDGWWNQVAPAEFKETKYAESLSERLATARAFAELCDIDVEHVIVDSMSDALEHAYEARPERLYVLRGGKVLWRCGLGPFQYDPNGLDAFLSANA